VIPIHSFATVMPRAGFRFVRVTTPAIGASRSN
jgi:hypothetical protein